MRQRGRHDIKNLLMVDAAAFVSHPGEVDYADDHSASHASQLASAEELRLSA
jgi:hypothetical protein